MSIGFHDWIEAEPIYSGYGSTLGGRGKPRRRVTRPADRHITYQQRKRMRATKSLHNNHVKEG